LPIFIAGNCNLWKHVRFWPFVRGVNLSPPLLLEWTKRQVSSIICCYENKLQIVIENNCKRLSIKDVRSQRGVQCGHFADKGISSNTDFRTFWREKTWDFGGKNFMVCPHGQGGRGLSQCGHFADKGEGSVFRDFVRTSFMDGS